MADGRLKSKPAAKRAAREMRAVQAELVKQADDLADEYGSDRPARGF